MAEKNLKGSADAATAPAEDDESAGGGRKVEPKFHAQPSLTPDPVEETAKNLAAKLKDTWPMITAAVLVLIVLVLFKSWRDESHTNRNRMAWEQFSRSTEGTNPPSAEKLEELAETFRGTGAEPFIRLRLGDVLLARGARADIEKALTIYKQVGADHSDNAVAAGLARSAIESTEKWLNFDPAKASAEKGERVEWAKGETATVVPSK